MPCAFISYASEDNGKLDDEKSRGWVTVFEEALRGKIQRLRGVSLWRDERNLNLPGAIKDGLSEAIRKADFLVPVLTTKYNDKSYTMFELSEFFKLVEARTREIHREAKDPADFVIPVLPYPLSDDEFPVPLAGGLYVAFFEQNGETEKFVPFFEGYGRELSKEYFAAIEDIVTMIQQRLKTHPQPQKATVYLALPANDQIDNHWSVSKELKSQKCRVVPDKLLPVNVPDARIFLAEALSTAQFSIHLLGATQGRERRSGLTQLSTLQLDLAAQRQQQDRTFRRLIWMPPDLKPADREQEELIDSLDDGSRLGGGDEFIRGGIEEFKDLIHQELAGRGATP